MKKRLLILLCILLFGAGIMALVRNSYNVWFATEVTLTLQHHGNNDIIVTLTDKKHIREIKSIIRGIERYDIGLNCGFAPDYSITFSDSKKSVSVFPPLDRCPHIGLDFEGRYIRISKRNLEKLLDIFKEYGYVYW